MVFFFRRREGGGGMGGRISRTIGGEGGVPDRSYGSLLTDSANDARS